MSQYERSLGEDPCEFQGEDGTCTHPDNMTPECHADACPLGETDYTIWDAVKRLDARLDALVDAVGNNALGGLVQCDQIDALATQVADQELRLTHQAEDQVSYAGDVSALAARVTELEQAG